MPLSPGNVIFTQDPIAVAMGRVNGWTRLSFVGHNLDVDTATAPETIWEFGGLYPFQTSAQSLEVLSDSASDAAAGTGMQTVTVQGLDASYNRISATVALNGVTPVPIPALTFLRVNRLFGATAGAAGSNVGNITLRVAGGGAVQSFMPVTEGLAHTGVQTVPAGFTYFVQDVFASLLNVSASTDVMRIGILTRNNAVANPCVLDIIQFATSIQGSSNSQVISVLPYPVTEKSDIYGVAQTASGNNMAVSLLFQGTLVDNRYILTPSPAAP